MIFSNRLDRISKEKMSLFEAFQIFSSSLILKPDKTDFDFLEREHSLCLSKIKELLSSPKEQEKLIQDRVLQQYDKNVTLENKTQENLSYLKDMLEQVQTWSEPDHPIIKETKAKIVETILEEIKYQENLPKVSRPTLVNLYQKELDYYKRRLADYSNLIEQANAKAKEYEKFEELLRNTLY